MWHYPATRHIVVGTSASASYTGSRSFVLWSKGLLSRLKAIWVAVQALQAISECIVHHRYFLPHPSQFIIHRHSSIIWRRSCSCGSCIKWQFCKVTNVLLIAHFVGCPKIPFMAYVYAFVPICVLLEMEIRSYELSCIG